MTSFLLKLLSFPSPPPCIFSLFPGFARYLHGDAFCEANSRARIFFWPSKVKNSFGKTTFANPFLLGPVRYDPYWHAIHSTSQGLCLTSMFSLPWMDLKPALSYLHYFHSRQIYSHWHLAISLFKWILWPDLGLSPLEFFAFVSFESFSRPFYTNVLWFQPIFNRFTFMWLLKVRFTLTFKSVITLNLLLRESCIYVLFCTSTGTLSAGGTRSTYL